MAKTLTLTQGKTQALYDAMAEYIQGRYGETGAYLTHGDMENPHERLCFQLLAELASKGAHADGNTRDLLDEVRNLLA